MMRDPRTPRTYFTPSQEQPPTVEELKEELVEIIDVLLAINENPDASPLTKKIVMDDLKRNERTRYRLQSKENAIRVVNALEDGSPKRILEALKNALSFKIETRIEPSRFETGNEMEEQIFWSDLIGDK